jgi:hypothetical protein
MACDSSHSRGISRIARATATAAALASLAACATAPPSAEERAAFGDVAVEVIAAPPSVEWSRPVTGWPAGMGMGAVRGVGAVVVFPVYALAAAGPAAATAGGNFGALVVGAGAVVGGAVAGVVWTPFSVVGGAATAPSSDVIDESEPVIRRILDDPGLWESLGVRFSEAVRRVGGRDLVEPSRATTVLVVQLESIEHGSGWNWWTFDRPFEVVVEATVRVVRRADGRVLWEDTRKSTKTGGPAVVHTYAEWAQQDGAELHAVIDAAMTALADDFAKSIFATPDKDATERPAEEPHAAPATQP